MRAVPPDEYSGAVEFLRSHGFRVTAVDSLASADTPSHGTLVDGKTLTAEEVVSLAVNKGWEEP
jgi:hypothetical protein